MSKSDSGIWLLPTCNGLMRWDNVKQELIKADTKRPCCCCFALRMLSDSALLAYLIQSDAANENNELLECLVEMSFIRVIGSCLDELVNNMCPVSTVQAILLSKRKKDGTRTCLGMLFLDDAHRSWWSLSSSIIVATHNLQKRIGGTSHWSWRKTKRLLYIMHMLYADLCSHAGHALETRNIPKHHDWVGRIPMISSSRQSATKMRQMVRWLTEHTVSRLLVHF